MLYVFKMHVHIHVGGPTGAVECYCVSLCLIFKFQLETYFAGRVGSFHTSAEVTEATDPSDSNWTADCLLRGHLRQTRQTRQTSSTLVHLSSLTKTNLVFVSFHASTCGSFGADRFPILNCGAAFDTITSFRFARK